MAAPMAVSSLSELADPAICKRVVLKIGSALLVDGEGVARHDWLGGLVAEIAEMHSQGQQVIVVSSGAIALGMGTLEKTGSARDNLVAAQAAASVGQIALAKLWSEALAANGLDAAQILLTLDDLEDRRRYLNATGTFERLLDAGAVPIVNENDSVATEEIRFGDNDRLAARIAQAIKADAVVLLSDVDGLYDRNPAEPGAMLIRVVEDIESRLHEAAGSGSASGLGSGGMTSKLQAAEIATRAGMALVIVNGTHARPLAKAVGSDRGTIFRARRQDRARKAWIGGRMAPVGTLYVDKGCCDALARGGSLLAAGITEVEGDFTRGELCSVRAPDDTVLAQGLVEYDSEACRKIAGLRQAEQAEALGHAPRSAVIHRDHMVML